MTMRELYVHFGLVPETHEFISHAMCLQLDEAHLDKPALPTVKELQVYCYSLARYGTSPLHLPPYTVSAASPEGFLPASAPFTAVPSCSTAMSTRFLRTPTASPMASRAGNEMAKAKMVIGDPSYFPPRHHPPPLARSSVASASSTTPIPGTNDLESAQIIIPGPQVDRKNDVFVCSLSAAHAVSARGVYIAIVSTQAEAADPELDVKPGLDLLGHVISAIHHRRLDVRTSGRRSRQQVLHLQQLRRDVSLRGRCGGTCSTCTSVSRVRSSI